MITPDQTMAGARPAPLGFVSMDSQETIIEPISWNRATAVADLIRLNLAPYEEAGSVLASTYRRLDNLEKSYKIVGSRFIIARRENGTIIGGAGIGPLHGLEPAEGLGEVRDLVIDEKFRGKGLGRRLLQRCLNEARDLGYKRLYLETTPQMEKAQKLFMRFGFRPVTEAQTDQDQPEKAKTMPCYYILEQLQAADPSR